VVDRAAAGAGGPQPEEAADDREVLEELRLLHLPRRAFELPEAVRDEARDDREDDHQQRRDAQLEAHEHGDAAEELHGCADRRQDVGARHALLVQHCGERTEVHELAQPSWDEQRGHGDARDEQSEVGRGLLHLHWRLLKSLPQPCKKCALAAMKPPSTAGSPASTG